MNEATRVSMINAIQGVDYAFIEPYSSSTTRASLMKIVGSLQPDVFIHNDDNNSWESFRERMKQHGTDLQFMQASKINSTTDIIERICYIHRPKDYSAPGGEAVI